MTSKDKAHRIVLLFALTVAMTMGISNVYSNLMATGLQVFIDAPWLALSLAMLMPTGALAIEQMSRRFVFEYQRQRYALVINIGTGLFLTCWLVLFADRFPGLASSGPMLGDFSESQWMAKLFTGVQMAAELFVSASILLELSELQRKYSTSVIVDSKRWLALDKSSKAFFEGYEPLMVKLAKMQARKTQLEAQREIFVEGKVAEFIALRARRSF